MFPTLLPAASRTTVVTVSSAQFFVAGPELLPVPSVVRVIETPPTGMLEVALTTVAPEAAEVIVTVQLALAPPPV